MEDKSKMLKDGTYECLTKEDVIYIARLCNAFDGDEGRLSRWVQCLNYSKDTVCIYISNGKWDGWDYTNYTKKTGYNVLPFSYNPYTVELL